MASPPASEDEPTDVPLTPAEQYAALNTPTFLNDLRDRAGAILTALASVDAVADKLTFSVDKVPITLTFDGGDLVLAVGDQPDPAKPHLYEWRAPIGMLGTAA